MTNTGRRAQELTPKQALFVAEYLKDKNATQAAIRAGYSEKTANQQGPRLLVNIGIQAAITATLTKDLEAIGMSRQELLGHLAEIIRANPLDFYRPDGELKDLSALGPAQGRLIERMETLVKNAKAGDRHTDTVLKMSFYSRLRAMELYARITLPLPPAEIKLDISKLSSYEEMRQRLAAGRAHVQQQVELPVKAEPETLEGEVVTPAGASTAE